MSTELVRVNFHGDVLEAVQDGEKVKVSLRRCCDNLGLDFAGQVKKLRAKAWACVEEMSIQMPGDNQARLVTMIDLDTLPGWLFSIDARKVKEEVREKLARYQKECAKVLANHFLRRPSGPTTTLTPEQAVGLMHDMHAMMCDARNTNAALNERIAVLEARLAALAALPPAVHVPTSATPRETIQTRLKFKGWDGTSKKQRAQIRRQANLWLDLRFNETPDVSGGPGGPLYYYGHQINVLDEAIDTVREVYRKRDADRGPGLFGSRPAA